MRNVKTWRKYYTRIYYLPIIQTRKVFKRNALEDVCDLFIHVQSTKQAAGGLMLPKCPPLLNIQHM